MEHAAIFIPASPASSAAHTPIKFRTPVQSRQGSIWIPATPPSAGRQPTSYPTADLSWDLLLDSSFDESYDPRHRTTSEASTATPASMLTDPIETTSQYLVRMSCEFVDSINNRDWAHAENLASVVDHSCFTARLAEFGEVDSYRSHLETYKLLQWYAPQVQVSIVGTSYEVDETNGHATVLIDTEASHQPASVPTHGISRFEWKRGSWSGEWLCVGHSASKNEKRRTVKFC